MRIRILSLEKIRTISGALLEPGCGGVQKKSAGTARKATILYRIVL